MQTKIWIKTGMFFFTLIFFFIGRRRQGKGHRAHPPDGFRFQRYQIQRGPDGRFLPDSGGLGRPRHVFGASAPDGRNVRCIPGGSGKVISGSKTDPVKFEEYWTFTRQVGNNPWKLSAVTQPQ